MVNQSLPHPVSIQNAMTDLASFTPPTSFIQQTSVKNLTPDGGIKQMEQNPTKDVKNLETREDHLKASSSGSNKDVIQGKVGISGPPGKQLSLHDHQNRPSSDQTEVQNLMKEIRDNARVDVGSGINVQQQMGSNVYMQMGKGLGGQQAFWMLTG